MRRYWPLLFLLASLWGASYLFIKVAVRDFPPAAMTDIRLLVAGMLLFGYLAATSGARRSVAELREASVCRARRRQRRPSDEPRRLGRDAYRLEHRRDRAVLGPHLRHALRASPPPARARRADPARGPRDRALRGRGRDP